MRYKISIIFTLGPLASMALASGAPAAPGIRAGFAERDITPGIGMEQPAGYYKVFHRTFRDPCKVRVAVFDDGRRKVALIGTDTLVIPRQVVLDARARIEQACGIAADAVMVGASHSHSSGPTGMVLPGQFDGASTQVRMLAYEESSMADAGFLLRVTHEIVEGVRAANANLVPAQIGFGYGHEDQVAFNRRMRMQHGQSWSNPGAMNPDILDYAAPIDPQVGVIGAWDLSGKLLGTIVNFACHPTTNPGGISANWPAYMEKTIQGALATRAPVVFLQGAGGDVGPLDTLSPYVRRPPEEWAHLVGGRVGAEAVKVLLSMARGTNVSLEVRQRVWKIKRRAPAPERVEKSRKIVAAGKPAVDATVWTFAKEILMLEHLVTVEPEVEVEVQAIAIGPAVCVSNPAEYFVEYGLDIKAGSPFPFTFPVALANGSVGYVPTEEAFSGSGGGYETRLTSYSNLEITAGRQFADTGIALAKQMTPGAVPERTRIAAPGSPWAYGAVAPELK